MYYSNGNIQSEISYKKGVPDGISKTYHKNGKVNVEATYKKWSTSRNTKRLLSKWKIKK